MFSCWWHVFKYCWKNDILEILRDDEDLLYSQLIKPSCFAFEKGKLNHLVPSVWSVKNYIENIEVRDVEVNYIYIGRLIQDNYFKSVDKRKYKEDEIPEFDLCVEIKFKDKECKKVVVTGYTSAQDDEETYYSRIGAISDWMLNGKRLEKYEDYLVRDKKLKIKKHFEFEGDMDYKNKSMKVIYSQEHYTGENEDKELRYYLQRVSAEGLRFDRIAN